MGSGTSTYKENTSKQLLLIIGKIENKSPAEQRLYGLCEGIQLKQVVEKENYGVKQSVNDISAERPSYDHNDSVERCAGCTGDTDKPTPDSQQINTTLVNGDQQELFTPLLIDKSLLLTQTYTSWRARDDLVKITQRLGFKKKIIYFVLIDDFPDFVSSFHRVSRLRHAGYSLFSLIGAYIEAFYYGMTVKWLDPVNIANSKWKITQRKHKKTNKEQYLVTDFYRPLQKLKHRDGYCIMGVTWTDLYPKEDLNFALGEANYMTESGVMSFGRFEPKAYDPDRERDITEVDADLVWKLLKVASHELGHLFGIEHCDYFLCLMNGSSSITEAMDQPSFLCPVCVRKVQHVCRFNVVYRYRGLLRFYEDLSEILPSDKWTRNVEWLKKCLEFLEMPES